MSKRYKSVLNFRDLGGLQGRAGTVKAGLLFRSGNLLALDENETFQLCSELSLKTFIDLRNERECSRDGNPRHLVKLGVNYVWLPFPEDQTSLSSKIVHTPADMLASYKELVRTANEQLIEFFSLLVHKDIEPVLYACTLGKDRTGVLTALLLQLLGIAPAEIAADFALSATLLKNDIDMLQSYWLQKGLSKEEYARRFDFEGNVAINLIDWCLEENGGESGLVSSLGLRPESIRSLYARFLA